MQAAQPLPFPAPGPHVLAGPVVSLTPPPTRVPRLLAAAVALATVLSALFVRRLAREVGA